MSSDIVAPPLDVAERNKRANQLVDYMVMQTPFGTDVPILHIHMLLYPQDTETRTNRSMQQRITPYITRANEIMEGRGVKIEPGNLKRTYRCTATVTA